MSSSVLTRLKALAKDFLDPERVQYEKSRSIIASSPYSQRIYESAVSTLIERSDIEVLPFCEKHSGAHGKANFYVRHDVDTAACMANLESMTKVDSKFGVKSGIYFLVDDKNYHLGDHRDLVQKCVAEGFEVGLHTICYASDDYLGAFEAETNKFKRETGVTPTSFTVHGLGVERSTVRKKFTQAIASRLTDYGYQFTDCHRRFRRYHYVIEDCHRPANGDEGRIIYDDFADIPNWVKSGRPYLLLTHPCYWTEE